MHLKSGTVIITASLESYEKLQPITKFSSYTWTLQMCSGWAVLFYQVKSQWLACCGVS